MRRHPVTVWANASIEDTLQRMRGSGARRVPVVDDRGRLVGIIAVDDIFEHLAQRQAPPPTPLRREARTKMGSDPI